MCNIYVTECMLMPDTSRSQWLTAEVMEGWKVGRDIFVGALCIVSGQLELEVEYDGSMERIHKLQYSTPNRKFPMGECINPWIVVRISDDRMIDSFATLNEALTWARGALIWNSILTSRMLKDHIS